MDLTFVQGAARPSRGNSARHPYLRLGKKGFFSAGDGMSGLSGTSLKCTSSVVGIVLGVSGSFSAGYGMDEFVAMGELASVACAWVPSQRPRITLALYFVVFIVFDINTKTKNRKLKKTS